MGRRRLGRRCRRPMGLLILRIAVLPALFNAKRSLAPGNGVKKGGAVVELDANACANFSRHIAGRMQCYQPNTTVVTRVAPITPKSRR